MKEYIVITEEEELYYNSFDYHELICCADCLDYDEKTNTCKSDGGCGRETKEEDPEA